MEEAISTSNFQNEKCNLDYSWKSLLKEEKEKEYFKKIIKQVEEERQKGIVIYPPNNEVFSALSYTEFSNIKVVIIGQDPYHGANQAHGLSFSVKKGIKSPPSLVNIYKEINSDLGIPIPAHGYLEAWAKQGVLMLNAVLTVRAGQPNSHKELGWEQFTDKVINLINEYQRNIVFMLWGANAQKKGAIIDRNRHLVLEAPHPSPFSAHSGFFGCKHFSKANQYLKDQGKSEINWQLD